ncbi:MAG: hypothetical protein ACKO38_16320 [Planctomycetota bacterium]
MRHLKKLVNVLLVIGAAALMSVPFKRVPPQNTNKNAGRGEWQLVKPDIPFRDLLKSGEKPDNSSAAKSGRQPAKKSEKDASRGGSGASRTTRPILPDQSNGAGTTNQSSSLPGVGGVSNTDAPSRGASPVVAGEPTSAPTIATPGVSYSRSATAITVPDPASEREAMKRARSLRIPRIEPLPEPSERLEDGSSLPSLPAEFTPL